MKVKPIMSVKEARKLLGKEAKDMTGGQVAKLVEQTHELAQIVLEVTKQERFKKK
jgi:hypothetical protein